MLLWGGGGGQRANTSSVFYFAVACRGQAFHSALFSGGIEMEDVIKMENNINLKRRPPSPLREVGFCHHGEGRTLLKSEQTSRRSIIPVLCCELGFVLILADSGVWHQ